MTATATPRLATATEVREWASKKGIEVGSRGRLASDVIAAFNKAHRVKAYVEPSLQTEDVTR